MMQDAHEYSAAAALHPGDARITKAAYASRAVADRFEEIWSSLDLKQEIADLGHGLNSVFKRRRSCREFTAMSVALWKLALERSFPEQEAEIFSLFMETSPILGKRSRRKKLQQLIQTYLDLCAVKRVADFTPVAQHMAEALCGGDQRKSLQLKLSLAIRRIYQNIFAYLI